MGLVIWTIFCMSLAIGVWITLICMLELSWKGVVMGLTLALLPVGLSLGLGAVGTYREWQTERSRIAVEAEVMELLRQEGLIPRLDNPEPVG